MTRLIFGPMRPPREDAAAGAGANNGSRTDAASARSGSRADVAGDRPGSHAAAAGDRPGGRADEAATRAGSHVIGIDAGSKTIKVVVFDPAGNLVYSGYHRHHTDIGSTLSDAFHDVRWRLGDVDARIAVTGSAGIEVARLLDVPFVQEVVAVTRAVEHACPDADVIIELGGEDSKIVYLGDDMEQRMNSTCAGACHEGHPAFARARLALREAARPPGAARCARRAPGHGVPVLLRMRLRRGQP